MFHSNIFSLLPTDGWVCGLEWNWPIYLLSVKSVFWLIGSRRSQWREKFDGNLELRSGRICASDRGKWIGSSSSPFSIIQFNCQWEGGVALKNWPIVTHWTAAADQLFFSFPETPNCYCCCCFLSFSCARLVMPLNYICATVWWLTKA